MADDAPGSADRKESPASNGRLDSWKEIAAYLKRDVTTVRRWEKREGLPVHRHLHERRDSVYAFTTEIDAWWQGRRNHLVDNGVPDGTAPIVEQISSSSTPSADTPPRGAPRLSSRVAWALAAIFAAATCVLTALLVALPRQQNSVGGELRFSVFPPDETSFGTLSLSPDGRHLAFTGSTLGGDTLLWIRPINALVARSLPDTNGVTFPFWSPESDALGFFAGGKLWTVRLSGGNPVVVCDAPNGRGGTWNRDGIIVFAPGRDTDLLRVPASGGPATPVTKVNRPGERGHVWPEFLPDGKHFVYLADSSKTEYHNLFVGALDDSERTILLPQATSNAAYVRDYLLYVRERQLVAQPFDAGRLALTGEAVTLADEVVQQGDHRGDFSVSDTGVLAYRSLGGFNTRLVWRERSGHASALLRTPAEYFEPTLSPDEKRIAVDAFDPRPSKRFGFNPAKVTSNIWIVDPSSGAASQFTTHPGAEFDPVWSPDGRRIVYSSNRNDVLDLYQKNSDGTGSDEVLLASTLDKHAQAWSPDGRYIVYATFEPKTLGDFWLLPMVGDRTPVPLLRTAFNEEQAQISPDGRWFAYTSNESGRSEVYVQRFPTPAAKWRISTTGGGDARWRADGRELFYIADDRRLMAVEVKTGATFEHGPAVPLFDTGMQPHWAAGRNHYDVSRDGRFFFVAPVADDRFSPFTIVVNWAARLPK